MDKTLALKQWVDSWLPARFQRPLDLSLEPLTGDAGFRQYFRVNSRPSSIAVYAPPANENNLAFVEKAIAFRRGGVHVPEVHAVNFQRGFLLLEDLGDDLYLPLLNDRTVSWLYSRAEQELILIQQVAPDPEVFSAYDGALLEAEMALFPQWFVSKLMMLEEDDETLAVLRQTFDLLIAEALAQPQVVVHRDYHSRNLLLLAGNGRDNRVGVVDFQDAVVGAVTYDLVSLLKDCYIRWPRPMIEQRALAFARCAMEAGIIADINDDQFIRWFDLMGLQRHIKVLGIFARLWLRDGKARYLHDLPLVIRYTLEVANRYADTRDFARWFESRLLPLLPQQSWYRAEAINTTADV